MSTPPTLVHDLLAAAAGRSPDAAALTAQGETTTFAELHLRAARIAAWLAQHGVGRGDRIVVVSGSGQLVAALLWGASRAGAVLAIQHEHVRGEPLRHVLTDSEPALLVIDDVASLTAAEADPGVPAVDAARLMAVAHGAEEIAGARAERTVLAVDPALMIYTSGSTAAPKAVVSTHSQILFAAQAIQSVLEYRADDVVFCPLPLSFDYGLYQLLLGALSGAHVYLGRPADVGPTLVRSLRASQATVLAAVPMVADALSRLLARSPQVLPLRLLTNTGAAMPPAVLAKLRQAVPGLRVQLMFGLTECKRTTIMPPDGDLARPGSSGLPLPGTEVTILDDDGNPVEAGEIGQITVRGPHVMAGYWRRPELTAQRFVRREGLFPELWTGDYGWCDSDGYLYFAGRRDDLYKERGFRVSATEVEAAVMRVPGVQSCAVLVPTDRRPAVLVAVGSLSDEELLAALAGQLEDYKIPRRIRFVDALPLTSNGKINRRKLAELPELVNA
ncbi:MAG TPA: class I adenylate-forming enzyme family protein [Jatrophihabitans sp.]|jgi:acyl-CoA synthetase (AMP-forming)/AMP-acid ligase II|uniref:class I adenylate-forming enzyme family protein n=1 Tax=Jatrophihabitans sp. TaxID=1932789 RepID=UPI002EDEE4DC